MTEQEFNQLVEENQPHSFFGTEWSQYSSHDFIVTFLPSQGFIKRGDLRILDGTDIMPSSIDVDNSVKLYNASFQVTFITIPVGIPACDAIPKIIPLNTELVLIGEVSQNDHISFTLSTGDRARKVLFGNDSVRKSFEQDIFQMSVTRFKTFFADKVLGTQSVLAFLSDNIEFDYAGIQELSDELNLINREPVPPPFGLFPPRYTKEDYCENKLLESLDAKLNGVIENAPVQFDAEIQIHRSDRARDGMFGILDQDYSGEFGFDRYLERTHGDTDFARKFFPIINNIAPNYRASILSLWPPINNLSKLNLQGQTFVNKVTLYADITQHGSKDNAKNSGNIFINTNHPQLMVNGQSMGVLEFNGQNQFSNGDKFKFDVECTGLLEKHCFIEFRENDVNGKLLGLLIVLPNNRVFTSNIQLVEVSFGDEIETREITTPHKHAQVLEDFCNQKSFNQALINCNVLNGYHHVTAPRGILNGGFLNDANEWVFNPSKKRDFLNDIQRAYISGIENNLASEKNTDIRKIKKLLRDVEKYPSKELRRVKKEHAKAVDRLADITYKYFTQVHTSGNRRLSQTYDEPEVIEKQDVYEEVTVRYRNLVWREVEPKIDQHQSLKKYKPTVKKAIASAERLQSFNPSVELDLTDTVYIFLVPKIEAFTTSLTSGQGVAGFTVLGEGKVVMLNLALKDSEQREELIAHEVGHAFGIPHPFEQDKSTIDDDIDLAKIEREEKEKLENALEKLKDQAASGPKIPIEELYKSKKSRFAEYTTEGRFYDSYDEFFVIDYELSKRGAQKIKILEQEKSLEGAKEFVPNIYGKTEQDFIDAYHDAIQSAKSRRDKQYQMILNLDKAETEENYLDYNLKKRSSFWYWQWQDMYCNTDPLKMHKL